MEKKPLTTRLDPQVHKAVKDHVERAGIKMERFIQDALVAALPKRKVAK